MELPLREILFTPGEDANFGIFAISEVLNPAIQEDWVYFSNNKVNLEIQNEEQRIVFGAILIPGMKVYRDVNGVEFNLTIDAKNIENAVVDFFANNRTKNVNQNHTDELVDGFTFFQSVITNDLIPFVKGFEHLPIGTAFLGAKVTDDAKWQEIKDGKFKGWSIHAKFNQVPVVDYSKELDELTKSLFLSL